MSVRVGLRLPPCRDVADMAAAAQRAEQLGFDSVWFPDSQLLWRDVYATLTVAGGATERITLGTAVTNVDTRHPSVLASAIRTVQETTAGRFVLGVGAGDSALRPIGAPRPPETGCGRSSMRCAPCCAATRSTSVAARYGSVMPQEHARCSWRRTARGTWPWRVRSPTV